MIYNIQQIGSNTILGYYEIPITAPVFLAVLKVPCYDASGVSKNAIIPNVECGDNYELTVIGIEEIYEDLTGGAIYFPALGTWQIDLYYQTSTTNLDPSLATYFDTVKFQVNNY